ncbi:uncharacterized, partial [Tachysurus ichikawai]
MTSYEGVPDLQQAQLSRFCDRSDSVHRNGYLQYRDQTNNPTNHLKISRELTPEKTAGHFGSLCSVLRDDCL